jgi:hypothetical protein
VRLAVVHTAQGSTTIESLGNFFASSSSGVSSHTGIDDKAGIIGEYVRRDYKAWTAANANPYSVQTEICGFAEWTPAQWDAHPNMLSNCAAWLGEECAHFGIPLVKLTAAQAQGGVAGVCGHVDLGSAGGGHWDPGPSFPWDRVMAMATGTQMAAARFGSGQEDANVALITGPSGERVDLLFVAINGAVHHWWANSPAEMSNPGTTRAGEILDGRVRPGGGVSGGWTADGRTFVAVCEGVDNRPYMNYQDGVRWSGWFPIGDADMLRTPA